MDARGSHEAESTWLTILNYTLCALPLPSFRHHSSCRSLPRSPGHSLFLFTFLCLFYLLSLFLLYLVLLSVHSLIMDILHPPLSQARRRSVDVGGLSLALGSQGLGQGWVGWDESEIDTEEQQHLYVIPLLPSTAVCRLIFCLFSFAELLSDMYNHTHTVINAHERSYVHWVSWCILFLIPYHKSAYRCFVGASCRAYPVAR